MGLEFGSVYPVIGDGEGYLGPLKHSHLRNVVHVWGGNCFFHSHHVLMVNSIVNLAIPLTTYSITLVCQLDNLHVSAEATTLLDQPHIAQDATGVTGEHCMATADQHAAEAIGLEQQPSVQQSLWNGKAVLLSQSY